MKKEMSSYFSENSFWEKIKKLCLKAGLKVVYAALLLFYAFYDPSVPKKAKAVIAGALGYFILPFDAIFDLTPMVGFTDDYGVLFAALATIAMHINEDIRTKAHKKLEDLFGKTLDKQELLEIEKGLNEADPKEEQR